MKEGGQGGNADEEVETRRKTFFWLINNLNVDNFSHKCLYCKCCCINMLRANRRVALLLFVSKTGAFLSLSRSLISIENFLLPLQQFCFMRCSLFRGALILTFWGFRLSLCSSVAWDFPLALDIFPGFFFGFYFRPCVDTRKHGNASELIPFRLWIRNSHVTSDVLDTEIRQHQHK